VISPTLEGNPNVLRLDFVDKILRSLANLDGSSVGAAIPARKMSGGVRAFVKTNNAIERIRTCIYFCSQIPSPFLTDSYLHFQYVFLSNSLTLATVSPLMQIL
jgi:hypothetical protein